MQFGVLSPAEIDKLSVTYIENERLYDETGVNPSFFGVNDPRMGTISREHRCSTCKCSKLDSPLHS